MAPSLACDIHFLIINIFVHGVQLIQFLSSLKKQVRPRGGGPEAVYNLYGILKIML
jgi:hypothetical protein